MNKLLITLAGAMTLGASWPAFAGPDFQAIEQARKARRAAQLAHPSDAASAPVATTKGCPPRALVLPLDHGPRADTTPSQNRLRRERHAAQVEACKKAAK